MDYVLLESLFQQIEQTSLVVNRRTFGPDARATARYRLRTLRGDG